MWLTSYLVGLIKYSILFEVNNGNDDKAELVNPSAYGLDNAVNIYFKGFQEAEERIGAWFIKPNDVEGYCNKEDCASDLFNTNKLGSDDTVFLLLHGNAKNRGASHRIAAYKTFQKLGFYTLTLDYRGYGDSVKVGEMSESTIVEDALVAIRELRKQLGSKFKLILYGHSMGSGVSTHCTVLAQEEGLTVDGILLDSPMHSMSWALDNDRLFYYIDGALDVKSSMKEHDIYFDSVGWLKKVKVPVRILHADVDHVVPIQAAIDLHNDVKQSGKKNIELIRFEEDGLGHIGISTTPGFIQQISDFASLVRL